MKPCKREIVDFDGIRTHFFPNLALYTCYNEELIAHHSENVIVRIFFCLFSKFFRRIALPPTYSAL